MAIGPDGAAYVCNNGGFQWTRAGPLLFPGHAAHDAACGSIQRVDLASGAVTTLFDSFEGERLKGPNDIVFDREGGFWFTDHGQVRSSGRDHGAIYHASTDGSSITRQRAEMIGPNGIGLSPDGKTLYVSETMTARVWAMDVVAPGQLAPPPPWAPGRFVTAPSKGTPTRPISMDEKSSTKGVRIKVATSRNRGAIMDDWSVLPVIPSRALCKGLTQNTHRSPEWKVKDSPLRGSV